MKKAIMPLLLALVILLIVPALGSCACTHDDIRCYVKYGPTEDTGGFVARECTKCG